MSNSIDPITMRFSALSSSPTESNRQEGVEPGNLGSAPLSPSRTSDTVGSFRDVLGDALDAVNDLQLNADKMTRALAAGEEKNIHDVMIAVEQVNLGIQLTMQIRNKVVEAYQEIMRMQV